MILGMTERAEPLAEPQSSTTASTAEPAAATASFAPTAEPVAATARPAGRRRRWVRRLFRLALVGAAVLAVVVVASVLYVDHGARGHVYAADAVPAAPVVLVLGAQVYEPGDVPSPFLAARLELARQLYASGRAKVILVSGDNGRPDYNEPGGMRTWLTAHGVPATKVVADYAGFDTYDSCARAKLIFGVTKLTVVTQSYHIQRAVSICRHLGIDANGVGDSSVSDRYVSWYRASIREQGADVKAVWDLTIRRDPVFLGPHETGVEDALND